MTDQPLLPSSDHHRNFRKLSGFAGAGFTGNNHDLVIFNRLGDFVSAFADRKAFLQLEFRRHVAEHLVSYFNKHSGGLLLGGNRFLRLVFVLLFLRCVDLITQRSQI